MQFTFNLPPYLKWKTAQSCLFRIDLLESEDLDGDHADNISLYWQRLFLIIAVLFIVEGVGYGFLCN